MAALVGVPAATQQEGATTGNVEYLSEELRRLWDRDARTEESCWKRFASWAMSGATVPSLNSCIRGVKKSAPPGGRALYSRRDGHARRYRRLRHISAPEAASALSKPKAMLNQRQSKIVDFLKRTPDFATMRYLLLSFRSIRAITRFQA